MRRMIQGSSSVTQQQAPMVYSSRLHRVVAAKTCFALSPYQGLVRQGGLHSLANEETRPIRGWERNEGVATM